MNINNQAVNSGDRVYSLLHGDGTVKTTAEFSCQVLFDNSNQLVSFGDEGVKGKVQILFWHNPIIYTPHKDDTKADLDKLNRICNILKGGN